MELRYASQRGYGDSVDYCLRVHNRVVLLHYRGLRQMQTHLVRHATLELCAQRIVAQHSPLRMLQRYRLGAFGQIKPYLTHFIATLHYA